MASSITILRSKLSIYKRPRSSMWQCRYKLKNGEWYRESTKVEDIDEATEIALGLYYGAVERHKQKLPQNTRKFRQVALYTKQRMQEELDAGAGKVTYKDYIRVIDKYLMPFFGKRTVGSITVKDLQAYNEYRNNVIGAEQRNKRREALKNSIRDITRLRAELAALDATPITFKAKQSTINTHNSALNRVFDEALLRGWITESIKPSLLNKGIKGESRGTFTLEEYQQLTLALRRKSWWEGTDDTRMQHVRKLLREYVLILANTGMRHGTEALGMKWSNIAYYTEKEQKKPYFEFFVDGKVGKRRLIARDCVERFLTRLLKLDPALSDKSLDEIIEQKLDIHLFRDIDGTVIKADALRQQFRKLLTKNNLLIGSDGKTRTLYSLRHMYATFGLLYGRDIYTLALQMGTSVKMLEDFYSKLQPRAKAKELAGRFEEIIKEQDRKD